MAIDSVYAETMTLADWKSELKALHRELKEEGKQHDIDVRAAEKLYNETVKSINKDIKQAEKMIAKLSKS